MSYLLDTCIVCELRKRYPDPHVEAWLDSTPDEELFISVVTLGLIQTSIENLFSKNLKKAAKIENWLNLVAATPRVIPITDDIIRLAASKRYEYPELDHAESLIGATAVAGGLMLVTQKDGAYLPFWRHGFNPSCIPMKILKEDTCTNRNAD